MKFSDVLDLLDFSELVSTRVKLTPSGSNRFRGLSPFTNEKTPSFYVDNSSKTWYCFSSSKGGGVLDYVMELENLDRHGAISFIKQYLNIEENTDQEDTKENKLKKLLKEANKEFLKNTPQAIEYLQSRGMSKSDAENVVEKYDIGFCEKNSSLSSQLERMGFFLKTQKEAGISYDSGAIRYENRITIPIRNEYGQIISFTGRDITGAARSKYLHGTTSSVFKKSDIVWNLSKVRSMIKDQDMIVVCEGQMDAIAVTEAGIPAVSIMGSKISEEQLKIISKLTNNVYMIFDSDRAGQEGLMSAFKMISSMDIDAVFYSVVIPGDKDPDEFIKNNGIDAFRELVSEARPDTSHIVQIFLKKSIENKTYTTKASVIRKVLADLSPYIKKSYNYRALDLIERLSQELGLSRKQLQDWVNSGTKFSPSKNTAAKIEEIQFPAPVYERRLLYSILKNPLLVNDLKSNNVSVYDFESHFVSKIIQMIDPLSHTNETLELLKEKLTEEEYSLIVSFLAQGLLEADFNTSLDVLKAKIHFRAKKASTNFLGRPITATEVEFKRVVGDVISYGKEPF